MITAISNNIQPTYQQVYKNINPSFGANAASFNRLRADNTSIYDIVPKQKLSFIGKIIQKIKVRNEVKSLVLDIPKQLHDKAAKLAKDNISFTKKNQPYYKPRYFEGLCLSGSRAENNHIAFKLDLLAELDPSLYVGSHEHPIHYIHNTRGYECVDRLGFENFEKALDLKLYEFALLKK